MNTFFTSLKSNLVMLVLVALLASLVGAQAEVSKEKRKEIDRMLRLTGMEKLVGQMKTQMISAFKVQMPEVPLEFWNKFEQRMDMSELVEKIIPLYDKYYTLEDLKAVNTFYETPAGQKILTTLPQIMQESMQLGQQWGARIGAQVVQEIQREQQKKSKAAEGAQL
jgi:hypothetical protein